MSTAEKLKREGKAEGLAEGLVKGRAETLQRQMARRFGPLTDAVLARLHSASTAELEHWTDRILDAASLADLFAD